MAKLIAGLRFKAIRLLLLSSLALFSGTLCANEANTLYFYNPEVNTARNTILKGTFDKYFASQGNYQFQPVLSQAVFEKFLLSRQADALILSYEHYMQLVREHPDLSNHFLPALQGEKNGSDTYFKLLVSSTVRPSLSGQVVASSRNTSTSIELVKQMLPEAASGELASLKVLEVPKAIDALMAVGYGLADLALTNDDSLSVLSSLYKEQYENLHIVGKRLSQKRMILLLAKSHIEEDLAFGELVYLMPQSSLGRRAMKLLGLDSWRWLVEGKAQQGGDR